MEVLLKSGLDVRAVDGLGHDAYHYARLSKNPELVAMVKSYLDKANRGQSTQREGCTTGMNIINGALGECVRLFSVLSLFPPL